MFPNMRLKKDNSGKSNFKVIFKETTEDNYEFWKLGGGVLSTSVTAKATGFHAHLKIIDDPLDPYKAHSETELNTCNRWLSQVLSNRVIDKRIVPEIIIMQRVHKKDPSGIALEKAKKGKKIKHICLPGDIFTDGNRGRVTPKYLTQFYDNQEQLLDPIRLDKMALLEQELNLGTYGKKSQIDQNPTSPGSGMFQIDQIKTVSPDNFNYNHIQSIVRYWDKAGTQGGGCYTVGLLMGIDKFKKYWVLDVIRVQLDSARRENVIKQTANIDGRNVIVGIEQEPGSGGKESAENTVRNLAGFKVYVERPTGDKAFRADPYSVQVNNNNVGMKPAEWNLDYINELKYFPLSTYKDQVDSSSGAFNKLVKGGNFIGALR